MPNKLIGQRFQINDRVSRKNYSVIANTYQKKYGNITEMIERKNSVGTRMYYYKVFGRIKDHLNMPNIALILSSKVFLFAFKFFL